MTIGRPTAGINKTNYHNMVDARISCAMVNSGRQGNLSQKKRK